MKYTLLRSLIIILLLSGCLSQDNKKPSLTIFHAGSLSVPLKQMILEYQKTHPKVIINTEAAGSVACARKITDLDQHCDIFASADVRVIDKLLIPQHALWSIAFAANEMVIAWVPHTSPDTITTKNWHHVLLNQQITYGRSDPNSDPCGYRTVMVTQLAEKKLNNEGLSQRLLNKDQRYIRPKETDLIALLESGNLDYIFIYRSVAQQHNMNFITLSDSINLKNPALNNWYNKVSVSINGKTPGTTITQNGTAMVYGFTIPINAEHKDLACDFALFMLSKQGASIMEHNGQPSLVPSRAQGYEQIPQILKPFALP